MKAKLDPPSGPSLFWTGLKSKSLTTYYGQVDYGAPEHCNNKAQHVQKVQGADKLINFIFDREDALAVQGITLMMMMMRQLSFSKTVVFRHKLIFPVSFYTLQKLFP